MALGDPYVSLTEMKARLDISDTQDDNRLTTAILTASRGIERFCGRQFNDAGSASARVYRPDTYCLTKVDDFSTEVGLVIKTGFNGTFDTTWATADYELEPLNGIVDGEPGWPYWNIHAVQRYFHGDRRASVQVTARWGWTAVPTAVKEACVITAEEIFKMRDAPFGVGGYSEYGVIKVRENPFASRLVLKYQRTPWLAA